MRLEVTCSICEEIFPVDHITKEERPEEETEVGHFDPPVCPCCNREIISEFDGIAVVKE